MGHLTLPDFLVIVAYLILVLVLGRRAGRSSKSDGEAGFFLAGRKLGKVYQFFLNFGNATDANNAISTASIVYQQGVSGAWLAFQMVFMNPYFWFMNVWFRRVRLYTMSDLMEERMGSRALAQFYAIVQTLITVVVIVGFGNLVTYKLSTALVVKPEATWTSAERESIEGYQRLRVLETTLASGALDPAGQVELKTLRERSDRGELHKSVSPLQPLPFYLVYTLVVGAYILMGGMAATAVNEIVQSILIVAFSSMLMPVGLHAIGGFHQLAARVPDTMLEFFGKSGVSRVTGLTIAAVFAVSFVQITGIMGNMTISGSARDEFAARCGAVTGTYAKRLMIILWSFCGLIGFAYYTGERGLADPDLVWGAMSRDLLGPGLLGVMLAGALAANMSSVATQTMSASALLVRNVWQPLRPAMSEAATIRAGRWMIVAVLGLGVLAATLTQNIFTFFQLMLTINVPFGAVVLLMFFWRRLTVPAVWFAVIFCTALNLVGPVALVKIPAVRAAESLTVRVKDATGQMTPVYFESVVNLRPGDPASPLEGRDRFHTELYVLNALGMPVETMTPGHRFAARLFFDAGLPFVLLLGLSLVTRAPSKTRLDHFFGKMKTPVAATPELDEVELLATERNPARFDDTKLFPGSSWEFTKWNRVDGLGFLACCAVSGALVAFFWGAVQWVKASA
ncbi:MAG TPA: hypothetical protein VFT72_16620 [Opitutaceae bacterium]|nr:hypothetical protein [Opitutaceae bacterium]